MAERRGLAQIVNFPRTFGPIRGIPAVEAAGSGPNLAELSLTTAAYVTQDYHGISFSADGLSMYVSGATGSTSVFTHSLTIAFDISTIGGRDDPAETWPGASIPQGMFMSPDGTTVFVMDSDNDEVRWATLSTPFALSSAGTTSVASVVTETAAPTGITFNADGTLMFVGGSQKVFKYALSSAYDPSTKGAAVEVLDVSAVQTTGGLFGMDFAPDGLKFYSCDFTDNVVDQWNLTVAFDLTTAVHQSIQTTAAGTNPYGLHVKRDGTRIYTSHNTANKVITEWAPT